MICFINKKREIFCMESPDRSIASSRLPHPGKAVPIAHIADDVKELRKPDIQQQQTLLSGRALKDFSSAAKFEGDLTNVTNNDHKYAAYESGAYVDKVDFNKLVDTDIRYVDANKWVNGPLDLLRGTAKAGTVYITAVLPSGVLTWDVNLAASWTGSPVSVRQIFLPDDPKCPNGFTRVGTYSGGTWTFSEPWKSMAGELTRIMVTSATSSVLGSVVPGMIYELHLGGSTITLPDPANYAVGTKIVFEQYANPDALKAAGTGTGVNAPVWNSTVQCTIPDPSTASHDDTTFKVSLKSAADAVRAAGEPGGTPGASPAEFYEDPRSAVSYSFEVVDIEPFVKNGVTYSKMWVLETEQDASSSIDALVEIIDHHTDQVSDDLVNFTTANAGNFAVNSKVMSFVAHTRGFFKVVIDRNGTDAINSAFAISAFKADGAGNHGYTFVLASERTGGYEVLDPTTQYYYYDSARGIYDLVGSNGGYVVNWTAVPAGINKLYVKTSAEYGSTVATLVSAVDLPSAVANRTALFFGATGAPKYNTAWFNTNKKFVGYIEAPAEYMVQFRLQAESGTNLSSYAGSKVAMSVFFIPDPHNSYVIKDGILDITGSHGDLPKDPGFGVGGVPSAESVALLRDQIVGDLQSKGLYYGNVTVPNGDLNLYINAGMYTLNDGGTFNNVPTDAAARGSRVLVVMDSKSYSSDKILPNSDRVLTGDGEAPEDKTGRRIVQMLFAERGNGVTLSGNNVGFSKVWMRYGFVPTTGATVWSPWSSFAQDRKVSAAQPGSSLSDTDVANLLAAGCTSIYMSGNGGTENNPVELLVTLPDPAGYPDMTFQIEAAPYHSVKLTYTATVGGTTETYEYQPNVHATGNNHLLYNIEHNNGLWYVVVAG